MPKSLLARKFLTHCIVNKEAVSRTFKPLWLTQKPFHAHDVGENNLIFEFDTDTDLERVLEYEPWTYDKQLAIFQRIDNATTVSSLAFNEYTFWVQIHDLPIKSMMSELGISIGNSIGKAVCVVESTNEGIIGCFLCVRVTLDVSRPLGRGRKLKDNGVAVGWAPFRYERLLNFCYWCGCLMHEDRDYDIWLKNKGKSPIETQQFGPWL